MNYKEPLLGSVSNQLFEFLKCYKSQSPSFIERVPPHETRAISNYDYVIFLLIMENQAPTTAKTITNQITVVSTCKGTVVVACL
jgi:hypothetical protein